MIKLFTEKEDPDGTDNSSTNDKKNNHVEGYSISNNSRVFYTASELRIQKDLSELFLPSHIFVSFPDPDSYLVLTVSIVIQEGMYKNGKFDFSFHFKSSYPHEPPKVMCLNKIYHPNIDFSGSTCLNILREDWNPVLSMSAIIFGLQLLFLEPNAEDALNKEVAAVLMSNRSLFEHNVAVALSGGRIGDHIFDSVLHVPLEP